MRTQISGASGQAGMLALAALALLCLGWNGMLEGRRAAPAPVQRFLYYFELTGTTGERLSILDRVTDSYLLSTARFAHPDSGSRPRPIT